MFSGIGGFELGIKQAYGNMVNRYKEREEAEVLQGDCSDPSSDELQGTPTCVGYSEIDKYAIQIYSHHFPTHVNYGDATTIDPGTLPDFDLLVGGFPCQAFSVAGKRRGFDEARGTLFFEIARVLRDKRPRNFVLENVKGLLSHDSGKTFSTILGVLTNLGYFVEWQVLNSKDFGVPQNRERVFIVGHLGGVPGRKVFPLFGNDKKNPQSSSQICATLKAKYPSDWNGNYVQRQPLRFLERNQKNIEGDYSFTVDSSQTSGVRVNERIRRLTPTECERLQGFPDGWTAMVSDTQRYKCLGNAVTVNVIESIIYKLYAPQP